MDEYLISKEYVLPCGKSIVGKGNLLDTKKKWYQMHQKKCIICAKFSLKDISGSFMFSECMKTHDIQSYKEKHILSDMIANLMSINRVDL